MANCTCPKCRRWFENLTRHHVLPVRHFGRSGNSLIFKLCRECHNKLEVIIKKAEEKRGRLAKMRYVKILLIFVMEA